MCCVMFVRWSGRPDESETPCVASAASGCWTWSLEGGDLAAKRRKETQKGEDEFGEMLDL